MAKNTPQSPHLQRLDQRRVTLRVRVPHSKGTLPAHYAEQDYPVMVSAGAFWRP